MRDLAARYLPAADLHQGETALAKIVAEREDPLLVRISASLSPRGDLEATHAHRLEGVLAPYQRAVHPFRKRPLSANRPPVPAVFLHGLLPVLPTDKVGETGVEDRPTSAGSSVSTTFQDP